MSYRRAEVTRVAGGLIAGASAAATPALLFGSLAVIAVPVALIVTFGHALLLGLPVYLALRRRFALTYGNTAVAGFAIGAVPILSYLILTDLTYSVGGQAWQLLFTIVSCGALGAIGGLVFRRIVGPSVDEFAVDPAIFE